METTYRGRTASPYQTKIQPAQTPQRQKAHPAQTAVGTQIAQFVGKHEVTIHFTRDEETTQLFMRENRIVIAYICSFFDKNGRCLSQGRGLSFINYQGERYVSRAILYARNSSLVDCTVRGSKMSTLFDSDEGHMSVQTQNSDDGNYYNPPEEIPSEKQIKYFRNLIEVLSSDEQDKWMSKLPQMNRHDMCEAINSLKSS